MSARYLARQSAQAIFTILMIVLLNFILFRMMPGSPDRVNPRNPNVTIEQRQAALARWGLDKPLIPDQLEAYRRRRRSRATWATPSSSRASPSPR